MFISEGIVYGVWCQDFFMAHPWRTDTLLCHSWHDISAVSAGFFSHMNLWETAVFNQTHIQKHSQYVTPSVKSRLKRNNPFIILGHNHKNTIKIDVYSCKQYIIFWRYSTFHLFRRLVFYTDTRSWNVGISYKFCRIIYENPFGQQHLSRT